MRETQTDGAQEVAAIAGEDVSARDAAREEERIARERAAERGEVDAAAPIPPNTLRLYRYRQVAAAPLITARTGLSPPL